mmetsp:Transcript_41469/g.107438  ORF Transcript_41469/g.107438 Transcript_41469/m.107438 type:complete len:404 (-) Transcript_41469:162-1373(-)
MSSIAGAPFEEKLSFYYGHLYPYRQMAEWLSYAGGEHESILARREFTFTLKDDIYVRYRSFASVEEFQQEVKKACPFKIDLGAVYNGEPSKKKGYAEGAFYPVQREIVFDIDLSDYDDVRACCEGASICSKCWAFMAVAIRVLNKVCREEFGFENLLFVYSGRRGVHCWVADERARTYSNEVRSALTDYLFVVTGNEKTAKKTNLREPLHPTFQSLYHEVLLPAFLKDLLPVQDFIRTEAQADFLLKMVNNDDIVAKLRSKWRSSHDVPGVSVARWKDLEKECTAHRLESTLIEIVYTYTYPRLDANVTRQMNHLLKAPFCVHPKSERLCVILDPSKLSSFNPDEVPTLTQLIEQYGKAKGSNDENSSPVLQEAVSNFEKLFLKPLRSSLMKKKVKVEGALQW